MASNRSTKSEGTFVGRALIVIALAAAALLLWQLRSVLALVFGALLIATIIRAIADPLHRHLRLPERLAVLAAVLAVVGLIAGTVWLIGAQVEAQGHALSDTLPAAAAIVDQRFAALGLGKPVSAWIARTHSGGGLVGSDLAGFLSSATLSIGSFLIVFFGGIFLAIQPRLYETGAAKMIPEKRRALVVTAMEESQRALRLWLKGQLYAMVLIGLMTWIGLLLIGVPSALVLGLISGVLEFIPYAGAITSAIPAILVALVQGPHQAFLVAVLYIVVHHVEAYVIQPLIQQYAVEIPAVITLFCLLAFGLLFGFVGILLAAPMAVVSYVLVKRLYVIEALDTPTPIPGDDKD